MACANTVMRMIRAGVMYVGRRLCVQDMVGICVGMRGVCGVTNR